MQCREQVNSHAVKTQTFWIGPGTGIAAMMTVRGLSHTGGGSPGAVVLYLENREKAHVSRDGVCYNTGYYLQGAPSAWWGSLATDLGLSGPVNGVDLEAVLSGKTPDGERFTNRQSARRMGNDLTFSPPKSVSIQALALGDTAVIAAHDQAVFRALDYIELEVMSARYGQNGVHFEKTGCAVIATYRHEDARPVDGVTDPALHTHAVCVNVTRDSSRRFRSTELDFGRQRARMYTADMVYKAELAAQLNILGYATRDTQNGFEMSHITDEQIRGFSRRTSQVEASEQYNSGSDAPTGRQRVDATLYTRSAKGHPPRDELQATWREAATAAGIEAVRDNESMSHEHQVAICTDDEADHALDEALSLLDEREAVHDPEQIFYQALKISMGSADSGRIRKRMHEREDIYRTPAGIVTSTTLICEDAIMKCLEAGRGANEALETREAVDWRIEAIQQRDGVEYSADQRRAIEHILTSTDQVIGIVGTSGSGKATVIRAVSDAARAQGFEVIGLAPGTAAADELKGVSLDRASPLATHISRGKPKVEDAPRYHLLDGAELVPPRDLHDFLATVRDPDRVLMIGDLPELQSVAAVMPYAQAICERQVSVVRMTDIPRRVDHRLREIATAFSQGRAKAGIDQALGDYAETVKVIRGRGVRGGPLAVDKREAIATRAAQAYLEQDITDCSDALVLAGGNELRRAINCRIRAELVEKGHIDDGSGITLVMLEKIHLTTVQRSYITQYTVGSVVRDATGDHDVQRHDPVNNTMTLRNRKSGQIRDLSADELIRKRAQVYQASERAVAIGDALVVTQNDMRSGIRAGERLIVDSVNTDEGTISTTRTSDAKAVEIDADKAQTVDYGYAITGDKVKAATAESIIVAGAGSRVKTAEQAHVATSRQRSSLKIITDDPEALRERWQRFAEKTILRATIVDNPAQKDAAGGAGTTDRAVMRAAAVARATIDQAENATHFQESAQGVVPTVWPVENARPGQGGSHSTTDTADGIEAGDGDAGRSANSMDGTGGSGESVDDGDKSGVAEAVESIASLDRDAREEQGDDDDLMDDSQSIPVPRRRLKQDNNMGM